MTTKNKVKAELLKDEATDLWCVAEVVNEYFGGECTTFALNKIKAVVGPRSLYFMLDETGLWREYVYNKRWRFCAEAWGKTRDAYIRNKGDEDAYQDALAGRDYGDPDTLLAMIAWMDKHNKRNKSDVDEFIEKYIEPLKAHAKKVHAKKVPKPPQKVFDWLDENVEITDDENDVVFTKTLFRLYNKRNKGQGGNTWNFPDNEPDFRWRFFGWLQEHDRSVRCTEKWNRICYIGLKLKKKGAV